MTIIFPDGIQVQGNVGLTIVTAVASMAAPKLATEINAASSLNISCTSFPEGWAPSMEQNKVEGKRRLCSTTVADRLGNVKYTLADLLYSNDPQGATGTDPVKTKEKLTPGSTVYLIERLGLNARTSVWAVGQFVNVWKVKLGYQIDVGDATNEADEFAIRQPVVPVGDPALKVAIVT